MSDRNWELVTAVHDMLEAEILKSLLEANELTIHIVREGYQAAYGITNQPSVRIELLAPNDQIEAARQIIADYEAGLYDTDS